MRLRLQLLIRFLQRVRLLISTRMGVPQSQQKGLTQRQNIRWLLQPRMDQNEQDRRSVLVSLSARATPILQKLQAVSLEFVQNIINGIPDAQLQEVYEVVTHVYNNKEQMKALTPSTDGNT